jgi:hypothetical protein
MKTGRFMLGERIELAMSLVRGMKCVLCSPFSPLLAPRSALCKKNGVSPLATDWTTYDGAFFGVALPEGVEPTHQERAYTSPIWYAPEKG